MDGWLLCASFLMYIIYHGDHQDMVFNQPMCFDDKAEAIAYAEAEMKKRHSEGSRANAV